jgi:hypothetical protein
LTYKRIQAAKAPKAGVRVSRWTATVAADRAGRSFSIAPKAALDAAAHGLRALSGLGHRLEQLPRMADFTLWATACETALWPAGTFALPYEANRRAAVESMIDGDPVASSVREIMAQRKTWIGTAADLLRFGGEYSDGAILMAGLPKSPRALAGRLRRAQPGLRSLTIEIVFSREGRAGARTITITRGPEPTVTRGPEPTVCTVSSSVDRVTR